MAFMPRNDLSCPIFRAFPPRSDSLFPGVPFTLELMSQTAKPLGRQTFSRTQLTFSSSQHSNIVTVFSKCHKRETGYICRTSAAEKFKFLLKYYTLKLSQGLIFITTKYTEHKVSSSVPGSIPHCGVYKHPFSSLHGRFNPAKLKLPLPSSLLPPTPLLPGASFMSGTVLGAIHMNEMPLETG